MTTTEPQYEGYDFNPWEGGSGLPDKITVRIKSAVVGYNSQVQDGKACGVTLEGTILSSEDGPVDNPDFDQFYTCGKGWEPGQQGAQLRREDGRAKKVNDQTAYYALFSSLADTAQKAGLLPQLQQRGHPFLPGALFSGMTLYMEREPFTFSDPNDRTKTISRDRLLVKGIVDMGGASGNGATAQVPPVVPQVQQTVPAMQVPVAAVVEQAAVSVPTVPAAPGGVVDAATLAALKALAVQCATHDQFVEMAYNTVPAVMTNAQAQAMVMSPDYYNAARAG